MKQTLYRVHVTNRKTGKDKLLPGLYSKSAALELCDNNNDIVDYMEYWCMSVQVETKEIEQEMVNEEFPDGTN